MKISTKARCVECSRVFDLLNDEEAGEGAYGHDCEVQKRDIRDKSGQLFGGLLCHLPMGGGVVSYLQVGERESERSTLITDRRER